MKTRNLIIGTFVALTTIFFTSCEDTGVQPEGKEYGILPERFKVDIPGSLTESGTKSTLKSTETDTLSGNEIYQHLTNFIAIGEAGADLVEDIIWGITVHHIDQVKTITYVSDDDNRIKNLVVNEGVEYSDRIWEYQLTVTDA
ncbi:MAG: hypothetical protein JXA77_11270, partial [Bacteroidales bacterium]|nr:hypothetical protein [Bacteroidales bacterium]MBN2819073.1 hypothetical protein [Bacteroidales bacterium]